jgi:hypothetical protein
MADINLAICDHCGEELREPMPIIALSASLSRNGSAPVQIVNFRLCGATCALGTFHAALDVALGVKPLPGASR